MRPRPVCSHLVPASPIYHGPPYGFISFLFNIRANANQAVRLMHLNLEFAGRDR